MLQSLVRQTLCIFALSALWAVPAKAQNPSPPFPPVEGRPSLSVKPFVVAAPAPPAKPAANPFYYADFKDAPVRYVLDAFFHEAKSSFSIDPAVNGTVTVRVGGATMNDVLTRIGENSVMPLSWVQESGVYIIKPKPNAPPLKEVPQGGGSAPTTLQTVYRRVAGVMRAPGGAWKALLVTGDERSGDARRVGIGDKVESGFPASPTLTVEKINGREVILTTPDGTQKVNVSLRRLNEAAKAAPDKP